MTDSERAAGSERASGPSASDADDIAIELRGIVKRFPGVVANDDIELIVRRRHIHAIVGENGAGKSTLMKILYGSLKPDEGTIIVDGTQRSFNSPRDAIAAGIGMVFQHFMLADNLAVWENVVLGLPGRLDIGRSKARIEELSARYGLDVDPDALIADLGVGQRQRVEILKVLYRGARILILDEPTAVLVPQEVDELFDSLRELTREGVTVLFISHKLDEVLAVADEITVIRAGRTIAQVKPADVTARQLAELMVGSELPTPATSEKTVTDVVELDLANVTVAGAGRNALESVSIRVRRGEVVGIAGVEGNGQTELIGVVLGTVPTTGGSVVINGHDMTHVGTRARRERGLGYIPEDRQYDGLLLTQPLWENEILGHQTQSPNVRGPWIDRRGARKRTAQIVHDYDVRTPSIDVEAHALSGGNQQKFIVGREMLAEPQLLLAAHPTRGIDVGAQAAVWDHIKEARRRGLGVLLVSADLEELIGLSDTLLVILRGEIVARLDPAKVTPTDLGSYMTGARAGTAA
ncbi:MAG: ABC transporter ATP-binding protein [Acidimicrobiales bacterium]